MSDERPPIDPYPLSPYVAWAGNRNRDPILNVFKQLFPKSGDVLELASGAGNHINYFAPHFPDIRFQPSDYDEKVFETIKVNRAEAGNRNVFDPLNIDLTNPATWPNPKDQLYDVVFVVNLFQVAPLAIIDGIAQVAASLLKPDGFLAIYGPFKVDGKYTTPSNEDFDKEILAAKVPEWGLKDVRDLERAANKHGIHLKKLLDLPANNFILIFGKA
jgi:cyclopropane fatty-acyl-phospholipid synthase-like methyltransferase